MEVVDSVSVALILQTRYQTPAGFTQALSVVSPYWRVHYVRLLFAYILEK